MRVFRLSKGKYKNVLSGVRASLYGQRWNSKGTEIIYSASSRALAAWEVAVHVSLNVLPKDYYMIEIEIPGDTSITEISEGDLPQDWNSIPDQGLCRVFGDEFIENNEFAVMKVPSVSVKGDFNYLINSFHEDFKRVSIISAKLFPFDPRIGS